MGQTSKGQPGGLATLDATGRVPTSQLPEASSTSVMAFGAVGDGVADDTAAVADALTSGRTVLLPAGHTFKVSRIHINGLTDVALSGYGAQIIGSDLESAVIWVEGGSRVRLLGLHITHNAVERNNGGFGIFLDGTSGASIRDCTVTATSSAGIYVDGVTHGAIEACTVTGTMSDGIHVTGTSTQVTVSGCQTTTTGDDGIAVVSYASDTGRSRDVTITGNTVYQSKSRGISCVGGSNVAIVGNTIRSTKYAGIYIAQETSFDTRGVSGVLVGTNTVQDANTYDGPNFDHPSILLSAGSGTELVHDIAIIGNQVIGGSHRMIDVDGNGVGLITNLTISGNQLIGPNTAAAGIEVARAADAQIVGNMISRTNGSGIYVNDSCAGVHVVDNVIHLPNQGDEEGVYGIFNNAATGRTSWNSVFQDSTKTGLERESSAADQSGVSENKGSIAANQGYFSASGRSVLLNGEEAALVMASDGRLRWTEDGNVGGGTTDVGLARDSAGVLKTTDGEDGSGALKVTGDVGFYGQTPASKPALSYSRAGEPASAAQIRAALAALGLVADNTTA